MVASNSTPRTPEPGALVRDLPSDQSAIIAQALEAPDDDGLRRARAVAELLRELNLDHESVAAAVLHTRQRLSAMLARRCAFEVSALARGRPAQRAATAVNCSRQAARAGLNAAWTTAAAQTTAKR